MNEHAIEICPRCNKSFDAYAALKSSDASFEIIREPMTHKPEYEADIVVCPYCNHEFHSKKIKRL